MNILSFNPGHDGAIAYLTDAHLVMSVEAEKDSNYRYSPISTGDVFNIFSEIGEIPDIVCTGGWWPRDQFEYIRGTAAHAGYRGVSKSEVIVRQRNLLGKPIHFFSSSHETLSHTWRIRNVTVATRHSLLRVGLGGSHRCVL